MKDILNIKRGNSRIHAILESIACHEMPVTRDNLDKLSVLMESYIISVSNAKLRYGSAVPSSYSEDAVKFERDFRRLARHLSKINEGFYNPFSDDDVKLETPDYDPEPAYVKLHAVTAWDPAKKQKIQCFSDTVKANIRFMEGDVIEEAPVIRLNRADLYSKTIRSAAIRLSPNAIDYALPFGCVPFYKNSKETRIRPNAKFELHDEDGRLWVSVIATSDIAPGNEIIVSRGKAFDNEFIPGDFEYPKGTDPIYSVKNIKLI